MNYGMYISASGMLVGMARQDVLANNLANLATPAYKEDFAPIMARAAAREEDGLGALPSNKLLERLGAGTLLAPTRPNFEPAALEQTGNSLDVGIDGPGFLVVNTGRGEGDARFRLTRDGRMTLDAGGRLVRAVDALPVVDAAGREITLDPTLPVAIGVDGSILQDGAEVARLRFVSPPDTRSLRKEGAGLYAFAGDRLPIGGVRGRILQQHVEKSGVDPFSALMRITKAGSDVEANSRMLTLHDQALGRAVGTLGRVS